MWTRQTNEKDTLSYTTDCTRLQLLSIRRLGLICVVTVLSRMPRRISVDFESAILVKNNTSCAHSTYEYKPET